MSGEKIRQARLRAGLTQEQLARRVDVTTRNVVRWEGDKNTPRFEHLLQIAEVCGVHVFDLLSESEGCEGSSGSVTREERLMNVGLAIEALVSERAA